MDPWSEFVHATEVMVELDYTADTPNALPLMFLKDWMRSEPSVDDGTDAMRLRRATQATGRAVSMGIALSAIDGPLPVMDVIAFSVVTVYTAVTWIDYFIN